MANTFELFSSDRKGPSQPKTHFGAFYQKIIQKVKDNYQSIKHKVPSIKPDSQPPKLLRGGTFGRSSPNFFQCPQKDTHNPGLFLQQNFCNLKKLPNRLSTDLEVSRNHAQRNHNLSFHKRRGTMGTLTTMTPESSIHNKSQDYNFRLSGKKFITIKPPPQIEVGSNFRNFEDIAINSPINSKNSNENVLFYNYFTHNPIMEGPEINLEQQLPTYRMRGQQNFSFNENARGNLQLYQNYKSNTNLKKGRIKFVSKRKNIGKKFKGKSRRNLGNRTKKKAKNRNFMKIFDSNKFDVDINNRSDKRTTLMIRNIPNKYTQKMMLETINKEFEAKYDFFYLPIDFENKCNVGYAFINLVDSKDVKPFFIEYHNKKWERFNSEKISYINYARIQGRKANLKHFQGSSVMKQKEKGLRPLMFPMRRKK